MQQGGGGVGNPFKPLHSMLAPHTTTFNQPH